MTTMFNIVNEKDRERKKRQKPPDQVKRHRQIQTTILNNLV